VVRLSKRECLDHPHRHQEKNAFGNPNSNGAPTLGRGQTVGWDSGSRKERWGKWIPKRFLPVGENERAVGRVFKLIENLETGATVPSQEWRIIQIGMSRTQLEATSIWVQRTGSGLVEVAKTNNTNS